MNVQLNLDEMTLGDVEILTDQAYSFKDKIEVLERITVDTDVRKIRILDMPKLSELIEEQLEEMSNPTQEEPPSSTE